MLLLSFAAGAQDELPCSFDPDKGPEMVVIDSGSFVMGSPEAESTRLSEKPRHQVRIAYPFAISRCEVTFEEYDLFIESNGGDFPHDEGWGRGRRPVINVSWNDALAYTDWLSKRTGQRYRLPSESEWEYFARAGSTGRYSWGETIDCSQATYFSEQCGESASSGESGTSPANAFGLLDVHGNVWEWTQDCWHEDYRGAPTNGSAWITGGDCSQRVFRGGSWLDQPDNLRSAIRGRDILESRNSNIGFRVLREL